MTAPNDNTPASIIKDAYTDAGYLQEGEEPSSEQLVNGMRRLTDIVNLWQTQGLKLWLNQDYAVTLTAGKYDYTFGPAGFVVMAKPLKVVDGYYSDSNGIRRPISAISRSDWDRLSQVNQPGQINSYFVDKQQLQLVVNFWMMPDAVAATGTAHIILQEQVTGIVQVNDTMNFPIEWRIALRWGLADELATGQPKTIMDRCQERANTYRMALEDNDVEDAPIRFTPDSRTANTGAFR